MIATGGFARLLGTQIELAVSSLFSRFLALLSDKDSCFRNSQFYAALFYHTTFTPEKTDSSSISVIVQLSSSGIIMTGPSSGSAFTLDLACFRTAFTLKRPFRVVDEYGIRCPCFQPPSGAW